MEENEFRDALRTVVAQSPEPPPMESATAVAAGKRAQRRRTVLACTGAVAALAVVTIVPARYLGSGPSNVGDIQVAAPVASAFTPPPPAKGIPQPSDTKPSWPAEANGDATADTGPRYQKGKKLLGDLLKVVPSGYGTPTGKDADGAEFQAHQAAIEYPEWSYLSSVTITKDGTAGQIYVEVHEPDNTLPTEPCALARSFWTIGGPCQVVEVGSAEVGVVTPVGRKQRPDQIAAYRYADGTVVFVAQSKQSIFAQPPLAADPFTASELAALTLKEAFHVRA
ncbi:hypothetical protein [Actinoplanes sp. HUAS TT8]|uniref:hypothetical protein n=1 Tax=Actinoplanes sp. HUAS TT8 TaxID=3447453 RepID=UPI003F5226E1